MLTKNDENIVCIPKIAIVNAIIIMLCEGNPVLSVIYWKVASLLIRKLIIKRRPPPKNPDSNFFVFLSDLINPEDFR